jgi:lysophospholipid acyltransferase
MKVLSFKETLASYQSVYYVGTSIPIVCLVLGSVIKPARPVKPKTRKAE